MDRQWLLIWWLTEEDCNEIGDETPWLKLNLPAYIRLEYSRRCGRAGRGRLWVPDNFDIGPGVTPWAGKCVEYCENAGGIVFKREDLHFLAAEKFPGIITDFTLNQIHYDCKEVK